MFNQEYLKDFNYYWIRVCDQIRMSFHTKKMINLFLEKYYEDLSLDYISQTLKLSKFNLIKIFKKDFGTSPIKWLWIYRTFLSAQYLEADPWLSIKDISTACGFSNSAHFSRSFKKVFNTTPFSYKKKCISINSQKELQERKSKSFLHGTRSILSPNLIEKAIETTHDYVLKHYVLINLSYVDKNKDKDKNKDHSLNHNQYCKRDFNKDYNRGYDQIQFNGID